MNINKLNRVNDTDEYKYLKITPEEFSEFVRGPQHILCMVTEDNSLMAESCRMTNPLGRLFQNKYSKYSYSDSIVDFGIERAFKQISLNQGKYETVETGTVGIFKYGCLLIALIIMTGAFLTYKNSMTAEIDHHLKIEATESFSRDLSKLTGIDFSCVVKDNSDQVNGLMNYLSNRKVELEHSGLTHRNVMTFITLNIISSLSLWLGFNRSQSYIHNPEKILNHQTKERLPPMEPMDGRKNDFRSGVVIPTNLSNGDSAKLQRLENLIKSLEVWENLSSIWVAGKISEHYSKILERFEKTEIINIEDDRGPAKARNIGIDRALENGLDLLVFMDDDVVSPFSDMFKAVCKGAVGNNNLYCPKIESYGNACFDLFHDIDGTLNGVYESDAGRSSLVYGTTCVMIAPRAVLEDGIRFDESFPLAAGEDIDFCIRAKGSRHKIIPADNLVIKHDYGYDNSDESLAKFVSRFIRYGEGNRLIRERQSEYFNILTNASRRATTNDPKKTWLEPDSIRMLRDTVEMLFN